MLHGRSHKVLGTVKDGLLDAEHKQKRLGGLLALTGIRHADLQLRRSGKGSTDQRSITVTGSIESALNHHLLSMIPPHQSLDSGCFSQGLMTHGNDSTLSSLLDGQTYSLQAMEEWLRRSPMNPTSPKSNERFRSTELVRNIANKGWSSLHNST